VYDTVSSQIYIYVADILNEMVKVTAVTRQVMIYFFKTNIVHRFLKCPVVICKDPGLHTGLLK